MRVLLINIHRAPSLLGGYYRRAFALMPPITLAYLAAVLERAGIEVHIHEDAVSGGDPVALEAAVRRVRPDVVGLSVVTAVAAEVPRVVSVVRRVDPAIRIVAGNIHAAFFHQQFLHDGLADVVVHGEGEVTFVELLQAWGSGARDLSGIAGISFLQDGAIVQTPPRPYIADLDTLPFPAWHLFQRENYRILSFARVKDPGILVLGSRGCPYRCTYCSLRIMGSRRRARSAANIAEECGQMLDRFGYVQPSFVDPIFPLGKQEGLDYAAELIRRGLHRKQVWITETRVDAVDLELLQALRESGLKRIMFGFEAADEAELKTLRKGARLDQAAKAVEWSRKAGVEVIGFFMLGVPGATRESMQRNIDYAQTLDLDFAKYTVFVPYPGTPSYEELMASGEIQAPTDWNRYTSYPTRDNHPVYVPQGLDAETVMAYQRRAHRSFYLRPRMIARQLFQVRSLSLGDILDGLASLVSAQAKGGA